MWIPGAELNLGGQFYSQVLEELDRRQGTGEESLVQGLLREGHCGQEAQGTADSYLVLASEIRVEMLALPPLSCVSLLMFSTLSVPSFLQL